MGRIKTIEIREKNRSKLEDVIPLDTPFSLFLETSGICNFRCKFCPTSLTEVKNQRPNGLMPYNLFCKIVNDMKEFPNKFKRINLYRNGEELLNKNFTKMIRYMKDANVTESIWTKTNGSLLNPELNKKLVDSGLDLICVSVEHVSEEGYKKIADVNINYKNFITNIADLYIKAKDKCQIFIKIVDTGLTEDEIDKFYKDFENISDNCSIEQLHNWSSDIGKDFKLGQNTTTFEGYDLIDKIVCPLPFFIMGINFNGIVVPCNEDFLNINVLGDLKKQSLMQIWNNNRMLEFRKMMLSGNRYSNKMCGKCDYLRTLPDNIDNHIDKILKNITK